MHLSTPESSIAEGPRDRTLAALLLAASLRLLVLCFVALRFPSNWLFTKGLEMSFIAKSLVDGHGFASPFGGSTGPTAFFAPAYPILVATVFRLFGSYSFASALVIIAAQLLLNLITIWLLMRVARQLFGTRTANIAGIFWACSLPLIWLPTIFWETCLSTCALTELLSITLAIPRRPTLPLWLTLGVACGLAALINPALLPSALCLFIWAIYQTRSTPRLAPALGLLTALLVLSPWPLRNARTIHAFVPTRTTMGYELWMGNHPNATGYLEESLFPIFNQRELDDYKTRGELAYSAHKSELALDYIETHPVQSLRLSFLRIIRFWTGTGTQGGSIFFPLHALTTTLLGFTGLWLLFRKKAHSLTTFLLIPLLLFPLPYYVTHAEFRFRVVIDPLLTVLAAFAVSQLLPHFHQPSDAPSLPAAKELASV